MAEVNMKEGIHPKYHRIVVSCADGSTKLKKEVVRRLSDLWKPLSWPVVRGFAVLLQSLVLGIRTLNYSFQVAMADLESKSDEKAAAEHAKTKEGGDMLPI